MIFHGTEKRQAEGPQGLWHVEVKMPGEGAGIRQLFLLQQSVNKTSVGELPYQIAKGRIAETCCYQKAFRFTMLFHPPKYSPLEGKVD